MRNPFRRWFSGPNWFGQRARDRRAKRQRRRGYLRNITQLESLEPRWLLAGLTWQERAQQAVETGREFAPDHFAMAFQTPAEFKTSDEARGYLTAQSQRTPFEPLVEGFDLTYSYRR